MKFEILNPLFEAKNANSRVLHDSKGTVKITEVYEKFSIAEGYEIEMKDSSFFSLVSSQVGTRKIKVGDDAIQVIE